MIETNRLIAGNNVKVLKKFPENCIDLVLTSPPYDNVRSYKGKILNTPHNGYSFPFEPLAKQLYRVLKPGAVIVWVVDDGTDNNGSRTGTSFKQCLYFKEIGFNIHDVMFYEKNGSSFPSKTRYYHNIEYVFILSKDKPKTINLINDRYNRWAGQSNWGKSTNRSGGDDLKETKSHVTPDFGVRFQTWRYNTGKGFTTKDEIASNHPAIFPEDLARDHILSWSNVGDVVLDPFIGSGTTAKMALLHRRQWIGIDINEDYIEDIAKPRMKEYEGTLDLLNEYSDKVIIESMRQEVKRKAIQRQDEEELNVENTTSELFEIE